MAHSVADVLSAHGLRGQVPHIPAEFSVFEMICIRKQRSCPLLHEQATIRKKPQELAGIWGVYAQRPYATGRRG